MSASRYNGFVWNDARQHYTAVYKCFALKDSCSKLVGPTMSEALHQLFLSHCSLETLLGIARHIKVSDIVCSSSGLQCKLHLVL